MTGKWTTLAHASRLAARELADELFAKMTLAARVEAVMELYEGPRGPDGERTAPMITREQVKRLLELP